MPHTCIRRRHTMQRDSSYSSLITAHMACSRKPNRLMQPMQQKACHALVLRVRDATHQALQQSCATESICMQPRPMHSGIQHSRRAKTRLASRLITATAVTRGTARQPVNQQQVQREARARCLAQPGHSSQATRYMCSGGRPTLRSCLRVAMHSTSSRANHVQFRQQHSPSLRGWQHTQHAMPGKRASLPHSSRVLRLYPVLETTMCHTSSVAHNRSYMPMHCTRHSHGQVMLVHVC